MAIPTGFSSVQLCGRTHGLRTSLVAALLLSVTLPRVQTRTLPGADPVSAQTSLSNDRGAPKSMNHRSSKSEGKMEKNSSFVGGPLIWKDSDLSKPDAINGADGTSAARQAPNPAQKTESPQLVNGSVFSQVQVKAANPVSPSAYLSGHNAARAAVGVGPLSWNPSVASTAQQWANYLGQSNRCSMRHGGNQGLGQNLAWSSGPLAPASAVQLWVNERAKYRRALFNAPGPSGCGTGNWADCGHYTQLVWRATLALGCGSYTCATGATIVVCDYYPPGNVNGQYPY